MAKYIMNISFFFLCIVFPFVNAQLKAGFYDSTCPSAEKVVQQVVQSQFNSDITIPAALLHMHFHDCFVGGCDASILIDSTSAKSSEKDAAANLNVRGFDIIDLAKQKLEAICPGIVSCADIITIATRDAVALAGGPKYNITTGRRDGLVSDPSLVNVPGGNIPVSNLIQIFKNKGFNVTEIVTLLGAHTVGVAHCSSFSNRLFGINGKSDPNMDPTLASRLTRTCSGNNDPSVFLDQSTWLEVDNEYYKQIVRKRGILKIDQDIAMDNSTASIVSKFATNAAAFQNSFAEVIVKMGNLDVTVGKGGEIRKNCRVFNS